MTIHMKNLERLSLAEMQEFVQGSRKLTLSLEGQAAIYGFIEALLKAQQTSEHDTLPIYEEFGTAELGRDAGIRPGQPEVNLVPRRSSSHLWFYRGSAEGPAVPALEPRSTRRGASVPDEGQRIEPGPDHAAHRRLDADAAGAETTTPTAQFSPAVLQRRCGLAGRGGRRSRGAIRASHPSHSGARVQRLRQGRVRRAVGHLGFPHLQPAPFQDLSTVPGARAAHPTQSGVHCRAAQTRPPREARLPARGYGHLTALGVLH